MYKLVMTESYAAPVNDTCINAIAIGVGSVNYSACGATTAAGTYTTCSHGENDIRLRVTAPCAGIMTVDLCQNN